MARTGTYRTTRRNQAREARSSTMLKFRDAPSFGATARMRRRAIERLKVDGNGRPIPR